MFFSKCTEQENKIQKLSLEVDALKQEVLYYKELSTISHEESIVIIDKNSQIKFKNKFTLGSPLALLIISSKLVSVN